jgi:sulfate permease, SulP family
MSPTLSHRCPVFGVHYKAWLRSDVIAGLSVWALMVPTSMGYPVISGVPVQYDL